MSRAARRRSSRFHTGVIELNFAEEGPADRVPLLLLHGLGARWQVFAPLLPILKSSWHILAPDLRGHGESARAADRYRIEDFGRDAIELLRDRVDEPAIVYGHSLGGWVGMWLAAEAPEIVRGLVIADSAIYPENIDLDAAVSYLADLPLALRSLATSLQQVDPDVMKALHNGRLTRDFDPDVLLPKISCPALLLQANPELGGLMTDDDVRRALSQLRDGTMRRLTNLGHGMHVENADTVLEVVEPFLRSVTRV